MTRDGVPGALRARLSKRAVLVALAAILRFGVGVLAGTVLAVYVDDVGGGPLAVSSLFTAYFFGMTVFAPVWGTLADVTGRRRTVLVVTGSGATVALLGLLGVASPWALVGIHGVHAIFAAGFAPVMLAVASEAGGDAARGRTLGAFNSARAGGFVSGRLAAGVLLGLVAPRSVYLFLAGGSLLATVAAALAVSDDVPNSGATPTLRSVAAAVRRRLVPAPGNRAHLRQNGLQWLYIALSLRNMTVLGVMSLMPVYLTGPVGVADPTMGLLLAINPGTQAVCMYALGRATDALGRTPMIVAGMAGSGLFAVLAAAAVLPGSVAGRAALAVGSLVTLAVAFSTMTAGALAFIGDVAPAGRQSELMGWRSTAKGVGGILGPPAVGLLAAVTSYPVAFLAASLLAAAAAGLAHERLSEPGGAAGKTPRPADVTGETAGDP